MSIKVDTRENELYELLTKVLAKPLPKGLAEQKEDLVPRVEREKLNLGDIVISTTKEFIIIERKTLKDLAASIKDGRYREQSFRLNKCACHNHNIIYLIEGNLYTYKECRGITKKQLYSAMTTLNYYKGFSVIRTMSIGETVEYIVNMADKLQKNTQVGFYNDTSQNQIKHYYDVVKREKKANITKDNIGIIMLSQIPSVSVATAKVIIMEYNNFSNLFKAIKDNPKCLNNLKLVTKSGKSRRISKSAIKNILEFLI